MGETKDSLVTAIEERATEVRKNGKHPTVVLMRTAVYRELLGEAEQLLRGAETKGGVKSELSMEINADGHVVTVNELGVVLVKDTVEQFEVF